jgi:exodeoxyribonuclease VII large subunit
MQPRDLNFDLPLAESRKVLSVSDLNREARELVESLGVLWVEGEISNLSRPSSGHLYWSLKDGEAQVRCAMFRLKTRGVGFELTNGQQVVVRARASLYEARGEFQLIVEAIEEAGEGLLRRKFEELKRRLAAEGLFDAARKKPLPKLPSRIGVITSPTGAALRDVLIALRRRFPATRVLVYPTAVQGDGAAAEIARMLALADKRRDCDVLILTRGGGSLEDLWAFNEEIVARAVAALETPVIVGVGHEIDFTIADFVADLRAPTPSQAAELAVPDQAEYLARLARAEQHLTRCARRMLQRERERVAVLARRLDRCHPGTAVRQLGQRLDELEARLVRATERSIGARRTRLERVCAKLVRASPQRHLARARERWRVAHDRLPRAIAARIDRAGRRVTLAQRALVSLSPLATLERGYAIVARREDGAV